MQDIASKKINLQNPKVVGKSPNNLRFVSSGILANWVFGSHTRLVVFLVPLLTTKCVCEVIISPLKSFDRRRNEAGCPSHLNNHACAYTGSFVVWSGDSRLASAHSRHTESLMSGAGGLPESGRIREQEELIMSSCHNTVLELCNWDAR